MFLRVRAFAACSTPTPTVHLLLRGSLTTATAPALALLRARTFAAAHALRSRTLHTLLHIRLHLPAHCNTRVWLPSPRLPAWLDCTPHRFTALSSPLCTRFTIPHTPTPHAHTCYTHRRKKRQSIITCIPTRHLLRSTPLRIASCCVGLRDALLDYAYLPIPDSDSPCERWPTQRAYAGILITAALLPYIERRYGSVDCERLTLPACYRLQLTLQFHTTGLRRLDVRRVRRCWPCDFARRALFTRCSPRDTRI